MSNRVKGEIVSNGKIVPVEVEIGANWLGLPGIIVHTPEGFEEHDNYKIIKDIDVKRDLTNEKFRDVTDEDREKFKNN